jgi:multiple sugar transport system permease protein
VIGLRGEGVRVADSEVAVEAARGGPRTLVAWASRRGPQEALQAYAFLIPTLLGLTLFWIGPVAASLLISFTDWGSAQRVSWLAFENYRNLFTSSLFWKVLTNTLYYTVASVPVGMALSLALALLANQQLPGIRLFRAVFFLPSIISMTAVALMWSFLFNPDLGFINYVIRRTFHVAGPDWVNSIQWAMPSLIFVGVWKWAGYNMVIFLAGLQSIDRSLYEAAEIDGARTWQKFAAVTWPGLSPTTLFVLVISLIGSFQVFDQTYIMTEGGPAYATLTMSYYIYLNAFQYFHMGRAAALAYILFLVVFVITVLQFRLQRRWVFYQ